MKLIQHGSRKIKKTTKKFWHGSEILKFQKERKYYNFLITKEVDVDGEVNKIDMEYAPLK